MGAADIEDGPLVLGHVLGGGGVLVAPDLAGGGRRCARQT